MEVGTSIPSLFLSLTSLQGQKHSFSMLWGGWGDRSVGTPACQSVQTHIWHFPLIMRIQKNLDTWWKLSQPCSSVVGTLDISELRANFPVTTTHVSGVLLSGWKHMESNIFLKKTKKKKVSNNRCYSPDNVHVWKQFLMLVIGSHRTYLNMAKYLYLILGARQSLSLILFCICTDVLTAIRFCWRKGFKNLCIFHILY